MELPITTSVEARTSTDYDFQSPLWDNYFQRTRKQVRFPRNYKEVSALDPECTTC